MNAAHAPIFDFLVHIMLARRSKTLIFLYFQKLRYLTSAFDRPGVQRLIADAQAKRINLILVKDLSRFGRNYIEFGRYIDYVFPAIGCRFIALNNGVDTANNDSSMDSMCFLNLFNEFYSRDTSKKVKAVKKACAEQGKFMGTHPPLGYKRDPADKHHFLIDEDTAPIVRRIFSLRASGMTFRRIATMLNEEGVPSPGTFYYQGKETEDPRRVNHKWAETTVKVLLRNEVYIGNMVQGKCGSLSYKSKKLVSKPKEEWIRVEGTHEPIISREVWDTVVSIDQRKVRKPDTENGNRSIFVGLVYCAKCGFKMQNQVKNSISKRTGQPTRLSYFLCGNYLRSGKPACTIHTISEDALYQIVLEDIRTKAQYAAYDRDQLLSKIVRMRDKEQHTRRASYEQELRVTSARVDELGRLMQNLYEDKCSGVVPQTVFQTLMQKYETERAQKSALLPELERKVRDHQEQHREADRWADIIQQYTEITKLDESILFALVDRIEVSEARKLGSVRIQDVKVSYRYVGCVDDALAENSREAV